MRKFIIPSWRVALAAVAGLISGVLTRHFTGSTEAAIYGFLVMFVFALPMRWTHRRRWKQLNVESEHRKVCSLCRSNLPCSTVAAMQGETLYLSWYIDPFGIKSYIAKSGDGEGWIYVRDRKAAHRFISMAAAQITVPIYDGSGNMARRAGIEIA